MAMHAGKSTDWIHDTVNSFRVLFVSIFFIGIGLQIELAFIFENIETISLAWIGAFITNHAWNAIIQMDFQMIETKFVRRGGCLRCYRK